MQMSRGDVSALSEQTPMNERTKGINVHLHTQCSARTAVYSFGRRVWSACLAAVLRRDGGSANGHCGMYDLHEYRAANARGVTSCSSNLSLKRTCLRLQHMLLVVHQHYLIWNQVGCLNSFLATHHCVGFFQKNLLLFVSFCGLWRCYTS